MSDFDVDPVVQGIAGSDSFDLGSAGEIESPYESVIGSQQEGAFVTGTSDIWNRAAAQVAPDDCTLDRPGLVLPPGKSRGNGRSARPHLGFSGGLDVDLAPASTHGGSAFGDELAPVGKSLGDVNINGVDTIMVVADICECCETELGDRVGYIGTGGSAVCCDCIRINPPGPGDFLQREGVDTSDFNPGVLNSEVKTNLFGGKTVIETVLMPNGEHRRVTKRDGAVLRNEVVRAAPTHTAVPSRQGKRRFPQRGEERGRSGSSGPVGTLNGGFDIDAGFKAGRLEAGATVRPGVKVYRRPNGRVGLGLELDGSAGAKDKRKRLGGRIGIGVFAAPRQGNQLTHPVGVEAEASFSGPSIGRFKPRVTVFGAVQFTVTKT